MTPNTLFRYRYGKEWKKWEILSTNLNDAPYRTILVPETNTTIEDTVVGFVDTTPLSQVDFINVTGRVVDLSTGRGISEGYVWIASLSCAISKNGSFYITNILTGMQKVLVFSYRHYPKILEVNLTTPGSSPNNKINLGQIAVNASTLKVVTFIVQAPSPPENMKSYE